ALVRPQLLTDAKIPAALPDAEIAIPCPHLERPRINVEDHRPPEVGPQRDRDAVCEVEEDAVPRPRPERFGWEADVLDGSRRLVALALRVDDERHPVLHSQRPEGGR